MVLSMTDYVVDLYVDKSYKTYCQFGPFVLYIDGFAPWFMG